jgi:hypothetical protein
MAQISSEFKIIQWKNSTISGSMTEIHPAEIRAHIRQTYSALTVITH